jgi:predicted Zn-dependent peptidase
MFYQGIFDKEEVDKERQVVIEEMKRCDDNPTSKCHMNAFLSLFNGLPFGHETLGTESIIKSITVEEIKDFKKRMYSTDKMILSFCGNIDLETADKLISKYFKISGKRQFLKLEKKEFKINPIKKYIIQNRPNKQTTLCVMFKTEGYLSTKRYALSLYSNVLGSGMSSRLFIELREKLGLAYATWSQSQLLKDYGMFSINIGTSPEKVKLAISGIKNILKDLSEKGLTADELQKAKNRTLSREIFLLDNKLFISFDNASTFAYYNKIETFKDYINKINSVSLEDVNKIAKEIYNEKDCVVSAVGEGFTEEDLVF